MAIKIRDKRGFVDGEECLFVVEVGDAVWEMVVGWKGQQEEGSERLGCCAKRKQKIRLASLSSSLSASYGRFAIQIK